MTLLSAQVALFVVVRFSAAFAFAFALVAVFALALAVEAFAVPFSVALALVLALAFALALANVIHFHWTCFSEVVHDPRLHVALDDRPQLAVVTLKLLRVHQQMVSQFQWASRSTTLIYTSSSSFDDERFSWTSTSCSHDFRVSSNFAGLSLIPGCSTACSIANLRPAVFGAFSATNRLHASNPFTVRHSLHQS